jgi:hypothetical protein
MQRIHYSGVSLLTGNDLAAGVVDYARSLAHVGGSAELTLPVRLADGGTANATLLLGPASQLVTVDEASPFDELSAPKVLEEWRSAMSALD